MLRLSALLLVLATPAFADDVNGSTTTGPSTSNPLRESHGLLDASPQRRPQMLSVFLGLPYGYFGYGFPVGISGRYQIPILHDGFIPSLNDSFGIEFGADVSFFNRGGFGGFLSIPVEAMWAFHLFPRFAVYAKLGVAIDFSFSNVCVGNICRAPWAVGVYPIGAAGLWFKLNEAIYLRLELGYPWAKLGVGFAF